MKSNAVTTVIILALLAVVLGACGFFDDDIDDCSIPQEVMDNPPADAVPYTITNQTCTTIYRIYVTPQKCDWWGNTWMGKDVLRPGESFTFKIAPGRYAFSFEDATEVSYFSENERIKTEDEFILTNADGTSLDECPASVTIDNQSDQTITGLYIHYNGGLNWLGEDVILPGESFQFLMFPDTYDIMLTVGEFETFYVERDVLVDHHITIEVPGD